MNWLPVPSNPASYYSPLAPSIPGPLGFWPVQAHTPTSGPLHMLSLPGPFPQGLHVSLPQLFQTYINVMFSTRTSQATF